MSVISGCGLLCVAHGHYSKQKGIQTKRTELLYTFMAWQARTDKGCIFSVSFSLIRIVISSRPQEFLPSQK